MTYLGQPQDQDHEIDNIDIGKSIELGQEEESLDAKEIEMDIEPLENNNLDSFRQPSIRTINSPRDIWKGRDDVDKPSKGLGCLWIFIIIIFISLIASLTALNGNFILLISSLGDAGTYVINYGYLGKSYDYWSKNNSSQQFLFTRFVLNYTDLIRKDITNLILVSVFLSLIFLIYITFVFCARHNHNVLLYIKCCGMKIPQRATVYVMFSSIRTLTWYVVMSWLILSLYGMLELNFWISQFCLSTSCVGYMLPHYGWISLVIPSFMLACCVFKRVQNLDLKFAKETMKLYFPLNAKMANSRNSPINLPQLLNTLNYLRKIIINLLIIWCFQNSALLSVVVSFNSSTQQKSLLALSAIFQPHGLSNELRYGSNSIVNNNIYAQEWVKIGNYFSITIISFILINILFMMIICRIIFTFKINKFIKFILTTFYILQFLIFTIFIIFYYINFNKYWNNNGKNYVSISPCEPLTPAFQGNTTSNQIYTTNSECNGTQPTVKSIIWLPDWGLIICCVCEFYMIKLIISIVNAFN